MKKILSILLLGVMMFGLSACGKDATQTQTQTTTTQEKKLSGSIEDAITKSTDGIEMGMAMPSGEEILTDIYKIKPEDVEEYVINIPMMNTKADEIAIIKAKSGKLDSVKKSVEDRKKDLEDKWKTYLPDQYEIVKKGKIVTVGDYILFIVNEKADKVEENFKKLFN